MIIASNMKVFNSVLVHEAIVLGATASIMAAFWFGLDLLEIDPPVIGWVVALAGELMTILIDQYLLRQYLTTTVIFLRCFINFFVALFFAGISGICVIAFDAPSGEGAYTWFMIGAAFVIMVSTIRTAFYMLSLATKFDVNPIYRWWKSEEDDDGQIIIELPEEP